MTEILLGNVNKSYPTHTPNLVYLWYPFIFNDHKCLCWKMKLVEIQNVEIVWKLGQIWQSSLKPVTHIWPNLDDIVYISFSFNNLSDIHSWGRCGRYCMVVGFTTTYAISAYHHSSCEFESRSWRGVLDTTLCYKVCQWLAAGLWFSLDTPVSPTNKTDCHYSKLVIFYTNFFFLTYIFLKK